MTNTGDEFDEPHMPRRPPWEAIGGPPDWKPSDGYCETPWQALKPSRGIINALVASIVAVAFCAAIVIGFKAWAA